MTAAAQPTPETPPPPTPTPTPPAPGTPAPAAAPGAATLPAVPPEDPENPSWLKGRLERERKNALKELGFDNLDDAKGRLKEAQDLKAAAEAKRLETLSEIEREKERGKKLEADLLTERGRYERLQTENALSAACAQLGVKNTSYASFLFNQARLADATISADAALKAALLDPGNRSALGAAPATTVVVPAGDTAPPQGAPPGAPAPGGAPPTLDAEKMDAEQWAAYKRTMGMR